MPTYPGDRFLCSFSHIFAGGYSAGYYRCERHAVTCWLLGLVVACMQTLSSIHNHTERGTARHSVCGLLHVSDAPPACRQRTTLTRHYRVSALFCCHCRCCFPLPLLLLSPLPTLLPSSPTATSGLRCCLLTPLVLSRRRASTTTTLWSQQDASSGEGKQGEREREGELPVHVYHS